jgi:hypothetical protein
MMGMTVTRKFGALEATYLTAGTGLVLVTRLPETETTTGCVAVCKACGWTHRQEHSLDQAERFDGDGLHTAEQVLEECDPQEIAAARTELRQSAREVAMREANAHAGTCRLIPQDRWEAFGVLAALSDPT